MNSYAHSIIAYDDDDHARRLAQLGLTAGELGRVVLGGYTRGRECTSRPPVSRPASIRGQRWSRFSAKSRPPTFGSRAACATTKPSCIPERISAIAVAGGTHETGTRNGTPHTRTPRGAVTKEAVARNQLALFGPPTEPEQHPDERPETWLLLHYYAYAKGEIRAELSLRSEMSGDTITAWKDRITLAPIAFIMDEPIDDDDLPEDEPIDIDVPRRPT